MSGFSRSFTAPVELIMSRQCGGGRLVRDVEDPQNVGLAEGVVEEFERTTDGVEGFDYRLAAPGAPSRMRPMIPPPT